MDPASLYYLGTSILLFLIFAAIVARTYSGKRRESGERAKYRMMDDEYRGERELGGAAMDDDKDYDGIRYRPEHKPPTSFTILHRLLGIWGICFMAYYLLSGWSSHAEYAEIKSAKEARLAAERQEGGEARELSTHEEGRSTHLVEEGREEFAARCASCHGPQGKGGIGPDLTAAKFKYGRSAPEVTRSIVEGRPGGMPPFENELSQEKLEGVVQYVLSLGNREEEADHGTR